MNTVENMTAHPPTPRPIIGHWQFASLNIGGADRPNRWRRFWWWFLFDAVWRDQGIVTFELTDEDQAFIDAGAMIHNLDEDDDHG